MSATTRKELTTSGSPAETELSRLAALVARSRRLVILTGAGCSTESGIPDYRDGDGAWKRKPPMHLQEFVSSERARKRYWARAMVGWHLVRRAAPNPAHHALAALEERGLVAHVITQNVDGLHQKAGSRRVVDLHGRLDGVRCLGCGARSGRDAHQRRLEERNPRWRYLATESAPDGDADLSGADYDGFRLADCEGCGGVLKPDVVFFGESVPRARVELAMAQVDEADALLAVGTSLMIWSGFRFARRATARGIPIAAVNLGKTRADDLLALKVRAHASVALERLEARLREEGADSDGVESERPRRIESEEEEPSLGSRR